MADLFLDIRERIIRATASDNGTVHFQKSYALNPASDRGHDHHGLRDDRLYEGELSSALTLIRSDSGVSLDQVHVILPTSEVKQSSHILPRMSQMDTLKLVTRKIVAESGEEESVQINLIPMGLEQNNQIWRAEYIPTDTLKSYKKEFSSSGLRLKSVSTALDAMLHAAGTVRDSIFNAHAVFEIDHHSLNAYYLSPTALLFHEHHEINDTIDYSGDLDTARNQKRRIFSILDQLHRINSSYQSSNPMTPLQKVWLCGTDGSLPELASALQDAMDVETSLLYGGQAEDPIGAYPFTALQGMMKAYYNGQLFNFMHPDLLRKFPLRKKSGLLIYIATALFVAAVILFTEFTHIRLEKQALTAKNELAAQKKTQTASAAFAKNLELLRKLSGNQVLFYPIFRELASKLPDGVYLDSFNYLNKDNRDTIDISATFIQSNDLGTRKTLTKLVGTMSQSPYLKNYREPSIVSKTKERTKTMTVNFICEVNPRDTAK